MGSSFQCDGVKIYRSIVRLSVRPQRKLIAHNGKQMGIYYYYYYVFTIKG